MWGWGRWNTGTAKNKSSGPLDHFSFTHPVQPTLQQAPTGEGSRPDCLHPRYPAFIQVSSNRPPKVAGCPCLPLRKGIDGKQTAAPFTKRPEATKCSQILARTVVRQPDKITVGTDGDIRVLVQIAVKKFLGPPCRVHSDLNFSYA